MRISNTATLLQQTILYLTDARMYVRISSSFSRLFREFSFASSSSLQRKSWILRLVLLLLPTASYNVYFRLCSQPSSQRCEQQAGKSDLFKVGAEFQLPPAWCQSLLARAPSCKLRPPSSSSSFSSFFHFFFRDSADVGLFCLSTTHLLLHGACLLALLLLRTTSSLPS